MRNYFLIMWLAYCPLAGLAQVFNHGDLWVTPAFSHAHDSVHCRSSITLTYHLDVSQSFAGDTVKLIDGDSITAVRVNTTGDTLWSLVLPPVTRYLSDAYVNTHWITFQLHAPRVASGPDTVTINPDTIGFAVPDACLYDWVTGRIYNDDNGNCIFDSMDTRIEGMSICATAYTSMGDTPVVSTLTGQNGAYSLYVQKTWMNYYRLSLPQNTPFLFGPNPCATPDSFSTLPNTADFPLNCTSMVDMEVWGGVPGFARPNTSFIFNAGVGNSGCDTASGVLSLVLDPRVTYNAGLTTRPADNISGDTLQWFYPPIRNITSYSYWSDFFSKVYLTPDPSLQIGDTICFHLFTGVPSYDVSPKNNQKVICVPVVNSADPNQKFVEPAGSGAQGIIPAYTPELKYTITFQNTGSATAYNVRIIDTIDNNLDYKGLTIVGTPERMAPIGTPSGRVVEFDFDGINLPWASLIPEKSSSSVSFRVPLKPNLSPCTQIVNKAYIYFDNNPVEVTYPVLNTIENCTGIQGSTDKKNIYIYPNPTSGKINLFWTDDIKNALLQLYTITGQTALQKNGISGTSAELDIAEQPAGLYFIEISAGSNTWRSRIVHQ